MRALVIPAYLSPLLFLSSLHFLHIPVWVESSSDRFDSSNMIPVVLHYTFLYFAGMCAVMKLQHKAESWHNSSITQWEVTGNVKKRKILYVLKMRIICTVTNFWRKSGNLKWKKQQPANHECIVITVETGSSNLEALNQDRNSDGEECHERHYSCDLGICKAFSWEK